MTDGTHEPPLRFPWEDPPLPEETIEVAEGIFWVRSPLPMRLDHVNCYVLDEGDSWTVVDTGLNRESAREGWTALLHGPLRGKPVSRVVLTHHHPDHVGLLGWFAEQGAEVWMTRLGYALARMMQLDDYTHHPPEAIEFRRRAGQSPEGIEEYAREPAFRLRVMPIPLGYHVIEEGMTMRMGGRDWTVHFGHGHARDHATFWSDGIVLAGDQIIPGISSNVGVWALEPEADTLGDWIESCRRLRKVAEGTDPLVLPGHKAPFRGIDFRLAQLIENHESALDRVMAALRDGPRTAAQVFLPIFKRDITGSQYGLALAEAVAHMNHLYRAGRITRRLVDGVWIYGRAEGT
jgi:glyoxylase-like metal-dependent hydrolase (beta-lactamase superfamily II)